MVINGTTLSTGGPALSLDGATLSLASVSIVEDGTKTIQVMTSEPASTSQDLGQTEPVITAIPDTFTYSGCQEIVMS